MASANLSPAREKFLDIKPDGMKTPEGCKRAAQAQKEWDDVTHELANALKWMMDDSAGEFESEELQVLSRLIAERDRKQEAFMRAVAGE